MLINNDVISKYKKLRKKNFNNSNHDWERALYDM